MSRIGLRNKPGKQPQFKHTEKTGAFVVKEGKGGINWYRYQEKVLKPLLLPFALQLKKEGPVIVQEDGASPHSSIYSFAVFKEFIIEKLEWPGNSPDLNAIEPCWFWMKRETTQKGAPLGRKKLEEV